MNQEKEIIDLSLWNEYIADDDPPRAIPCGIELETMSICTAVSYRQVARDDFPTSLETSPDAITSRLFWRIKRA